MRRSVLAIIALMCVVAVGGCISGDAPVPTRAPPREPPAAPVLTTTAFSGDGRSEGFACLADVCHYAEPSEDVYLPETGPVQTIRATVTWTPRDPTITELEVFLFTEGPDGEWSYSFDEGHYWAGTSPLAIESAPLEQNTTAHFLHGRAIHRPIDGQRTGGGVSQSYHVEGAVEGAYSEPHH